MSAAKECGGVVAVAGLVISVGFLTFSSYPWYIDLWSLYVAGSYCSYYFLQAVIQEITRAGRIK